MKTALIGYTGFVGGNLASQHSFDDLYNSKNIAEIIGKDYDLVVSAGTRAEKWRINQQPENDLAEINNLITNLKQVKTKKLVLISTIDVYKNPVNIDEETRITTEGLHAYGVNRYYLESFIDNNFNALTVRLPGLFGHGLKKNIIYDFMHNNNIDKIHHAGLVQYYNLSNIWRDIETAIDNNLRLINFATEPIRTDELALHCFNISNFKNEPEDIVPSAYDMHTKHSALFGGHGHYMYRKGEILRQIKIFVNETRGKQ